jgi:hypothetical protein
LRIQDHYAVILHAGYNDTVQPLTSAWQVAGPKEDDHRPIVLDEVLQAG